MSGRLETDFEAEIVELFAVGVAELREAGYEDWGSQMRDIGVVDEDVPRVLALRHVAIVERQMGPVPCALAASSNVRVPVTG